MLEKHALMILNPQAGRGRAGTLADDLRDHARALDWDIELRLTDHAGDEARLGAAGSTEGWPIVIAVGGDGTVHGVANGVLQSGSSVPTLAYVPVGTGNDFASTVGLNRARHPKANLERILRGSVHHLDVGRALGEYFLNSCGVGFGPEVVRRTREFPRLRGFPLYVAAVVRAFFAFHATTYTVTSEQHVEEDRLLMLEASLGETVGGGFKLTSDADPCDGVFDVCVIHEINRLRFLRYLISGLRGTLGRLEAVTMFRTPRFTVETRSPPLTAHLDGELRTSSDQTVTVELLPGRLPVLCAIPPHFDRRPVFLRGT